MVEDGFQRNLGRKDLARRVDEARRQEAVTAEFKEVVVDADPLYPENLFEQAADNSFPVGARCGIGSLGAEVRIGQVPAVGLAARGEGQAVELDKGRRHHVVGQCCREVPAQLGGVEVTDDVGAEALFAPGRQRG